MKYYIWVFLPDLFKQFWDYNCNYNRFKDPRVPEAHRHGALVEYAWKND